MKKAIIFLFAAAFAASLSACGSSGSSKATEPSATEAVTEAVTESVTEATTAAPDGSYTGLWKMESIKTDVEQPVGTTVTATLELNTDNTFTVQQNMQIEAYIGEIELTGEYNIDGATLTLNVKHYKAKSNGENIDQDYRHEFTGIFDADGKLQLQLEGARMTMVRE